MGRAEVIAAEFRARIANGDLAPGDLLPSARRITRDHGVAVATATRAVALLRAQGLVRTVPGRGVVVAAPARRPQRRPGAAATPASLTSDRIVAAAVAIADAEGLGAVGVRRVAAELRAAPMALYRHVGGKTGLVLRMLDATLREWSPPAPPPEHWRDRAEAGALGMWAVLRRHPWLGPALSMTRPQYVPAGLGYMDWMLEALAGSGLGRGEAAEVYLALFGFARGLAATLDAEADAEAASGRDQEAWLAEQPPIDPAAFPRVAALVTDPRRPDLDAVLRNAVAWLLDGVEARVSGRR